MKHVLVELAVHWLCNWVVVCLNLAKNELNILFAKFSFGMNKKGQIFPPFLPYVLNKSNNHKS